jgi:hypothetical protein
VHRQLRAPYRVCILPDDALLYNRRLYSEHLLLNFHKGYLIQPDSMLGTLGAFYDIHNKLANVMRDKCFALPSNMKLPGLYVYLEGYILISQVCFQSACM